MRFRYAESGGREVIEADDADDDDDRHDGDDDGKDAVTVGLVVLLQMARIDGDEGDGERAAGDEIVEPVGNGERGPEGVGLAGGAEERGDDRVAHEAEHARQEHGDDEDGRGEAEPTRRRRFGHSYLYEKFLDGVLLELANVTGGVIVEDDGRRRRVVDLAAARRRRCSAVHDDEHAIRRVPVVHIPRLSQESRRRRTR